MNSYSFIMSHKHLKLSADTDKSRRVLFKRRYVIGLFLCCFIGMLYSACVPVLASAGTNSAAGKASASLPAQGIYEISSAVDTGFVLDIRHSAASAADSQSTADSQSAASESAALLSDAGASALQLHRPLQVKQQEFYLEYMPSGKCRIVSLLSGQYLAEGELAIDPIVDDQNADEGEADANNDKYSSGSVVLVSSDPKTGLPTNSQTDEEALLWELTAQDDGSFLVASKAGLCLSLDPESGSVYNGSRLSLVPYSGNQDQKWIFSPVPVYPQNTADTDHVNPYEEDGKLSDTQVTIVFQGNREVISTDVLASWMKSSDDASDGADSAGNSDTSDTAYEGWSLDEEMLKAYVAGLAEKYNRFGLPQKFTTSYGTDVTIYEVNIGWKLDEEAMLSRIKKAISLDGHHSIFPVWAEHGGDYNGTNTDIGDSYVEIDLTGQKVWLYKNGERLLETDCVSGTANTGRATPSGVYYIFYKQSPSTLTGADYSSYVNFWMPFNGNIGLHDAPWRGSFGGDIYKTNGSHGCVNLPYEAAKTLYETTKLGYPVVCYH